MSLLDDLRNQADSQRASEEEKAARRAEREQFYQEKMLPRMIKAYQFFKEFADHLNYIKMETIVNYPLLPGGVPQPLRQEGYKVQIDSSKAIKKIDFTMEGVLEEPVEFEIEGKDPVFNHRERIKSYSFRHDYKERRDADQYIQSAQFILQGPLPLKIMVEADVDTSEFKLTVRNFSGPGFSKYNLKFDEFDDDFLDKIGKFVLRKEEVLVGRKEELSEEARKKLRDRMIVEARIRQQELLEAEQRRKAEEEAQREKSAKEQLKRAVNTTVSQGKESLKDMFTKLKKQAGFDSTPGQNSIPAPATPKAPVPPAAPKPTAQQAPVPPAAPKLTAQQAPVASATPAQTTQKVPVVPPVATKPAKQPEVPSTPAAAAAKQQVPITPKTVAPDTNKQASSAAPSTHNPFLTLGRTIGHKVKDVTASSGKSEADTQEYVMPAKVKFAAPDPKRHAQSSISVKSNPFLKPEDLEEVPASTTSVDDSDKQEKPVLKPGELNTELVADLTKSQPDQVQEDQQQEENSSTSPEASTAPAENPFLKPAAMNSGLSTSTSPAQNASNPGKDSSSGSQASVTPKPKPVLNRTEPDAGVTASRPAQKQQAAISEGKQSPVAPASTSSTQKPALQQGSTVQEAAETELSLNTGELALEAINEDSPATEVNKSAESTQEPVPVQEAGEADLSINTGELALEGIKQDSPSAETDESAVTTQNPSLEQELIEADLALKAAQLSLEDEKEDASPVMTNESAVTTQNPAIKQEQLKDLPDAKEVAEKEQQPPHQALSLEPTANTTEDLSSDLDDIDIDLSANVTPPQNDEGPEQKS